MSRTTRVLPWAVVLVVVGAPLAQASAASLSRTPLAPSATTTPAVAPSAAQVTGSTVTPAPAATEPATSTPATSPSATPSATAADPATADPATADPTTADPATPTPAPTTAAPVPSPTSPPPASPPAASATPTAPATLAGPAPTRSPYYGRGSTWDANEPQRRLAIYGDSLVMQTKPLLGALAATRATALDVWELPGGAPCDLLPKYGGRMRAFGTQRVELAFVGNATSACMTSRIGGRPPGVLSLAKRQQIASAYTADLSALIRWNRNNRVLTYLVLPPAMARGTWHGQLTASLTAAMTRLAAQNPAHVRLNRAPRDTLTPGGVYRQTTVLNGRTVQLRHRDGTHLFAPVGTTLNAQALLWPIALEP